jgi:pimeloyl-ACP methyl ester carboxylesterase/DNA-binding winged helix-turn-helix (wHTH) protein
MRFLFGDYTLDADRRELRCGGALVPVEPQVFDLLLHTIRNRDRVVSKDDLLAAVWNGRIVSESALANRINAARRAIGDSGESQKLIRTIARRGIRFVGEVHEDASGGERVAPVITPSDTSRPAKQPTQDIRYCSTKDGVQIAYAVTGQGSPVVKATNWMSHLQYEWESPMGHWIAGLSAETRLIRYDQRGSGLSDRNVGDMSFGAMVSDLESVVDAAGPERFVLFGMSQGCAFSVAYAVRHPERVSHLVLYGGFAKGWRAFGNAKEIAGQTALMTLIRQGWGRNNPAFRQLFTSLFIPGATPEQMEGFNELQRQCASPEAAAALYSALGDLDVTDLLPKVRTPTLVLHANKDAIVPINAGRAFATGIPGATFVPLDSSNHILLAEEPAFSVLMAEVRRFIADAQR